MRFLRRRRAQACRRTLLPQPERPYNIHEVRAWSKQPLESLAPLCSSVLRQSLRLPGAGSCGAGPALVKPAKDGDDDGLRDFKVKGRLQEDEDKLNLRLRICQPDREALPAAPHSSRVANLLTWASLTAIDWAAGAAKVVEFDFDLTNDTAMSVASEMVEEMSLSHNDAHRIAQAIKEEIFNLTQKARQAAEQVSGHSSDEDAAIQRRALSDSGLAEQTAIANLEVCTYSSAVSLEAERQACGRPERCPVHCSHPPTWPAGRAQTASPQWTATGTPKPPRRRRTPCSRWETAAATLWRTPRRQTATCPSTAARPASR